MGKLELFRDIVTYSAGSLIIGILLTILFVILMFVIIKGFFPKSTFSPLTIVVGIVLTLFLGKEMVTMCGAISLKWMCDDYETYVNSLIPTEALTAGIPLDRTETDAIVNQSLKEFPIISAYVTNGEFEGQTTSNIAHTMADTLNSYLNRFILYAILWSLLYLAIASGLVIWTLKKEWDNKIDTKQRTTGKLSGRYSRFRHTSAGHSRSTRFRR